MASTARDYQIPMDSKRESLRPVSRDLHAHSPRSTAPLAPSDSRKRALVKWSNPQKNFCYLTLPDQRDVFLHRDDFAGEWPPQYMKTVIFELVESGHRSCPLRAKEANIVGAEKS